MKRQTILISSLVVLGVIGLFSIFVLHEKKSNLNTSQMVVTIISKTNSEVTVRDRKNIIYTIQSDDLVTELGSDVVIEYTGVLNQNSKYQDIEVINYETVPVSLDEDGVPYSWNDQGIFETYYILAKNKLNSLTLDEKIGQLFLVRYKETTALEDLKKYHFSGFVFYEDAFQNKITEEVQGMIAQLQDNSKIPLLTAVDEEGGKVVRISNNSKLVTTPFLSSKELYQTGGFDLIKQDTIKKSAILKDLGINLNLAPVVDVSTDSSDYIYERTLGEDTTLTSTYAKTVIDASKNTGVSYTLKHFPGYANNHDTHAGISTDNRTYDEIKTQDLPPFEAGISSGVEAILVSHNTVTSIDASNPASLSASVHNVLRSDLSFTGVVISDDISMAALSSIDNVAVKAILAGNNLIISTNYEEDIQAVKKAVENGTISEEAIDNLAFKVLAWKYYKGLMIDKTK